MGSVVYSALYPMGIEGFFPQNKVTRPWSWPLTSI